MKRQIKAGEDPAEFRACGRKKRYATRVESFFLNLFELLTFCVFKMHHSKPHHRFSILSDFICYFACIYYLF